MLMPFFFVELEHVIIMDQRSSSEEYIPSSCGPALLGMLTFFIIFQNVAFVFSLPSKTILRFRFVNFFLWISVFGIENFVIEMSV